MPQFTDSWLEGERRKGEGAWWNHACFKIPQLTTHRLLLRAFRPDDFEPYAAMMADPDVSRHLMDGRPLTRPEAWRQLAMFAGHWILRGYGLWAVEDRATGQFLGRIGCLNPEGFPAFEIAYTLGRWAWGKAKPRLSFHGWFVGWAATWKLLAVPGLLQLP
jgi:Acetyltransferase (GNAT) domain